MAECLQDWYWMLCSSLDVTGMVLALASVLNFVYFEGTAAAS